jgi:5-methylcytosine-specific restriction endonuclease McrA
MNNSERIAMNNFELQEKLKCLIGQERKITREILELIYLADQRQVFLERGYASLFEWLTKFYGYSESAAQRRIQAARLLGAAPALKEKINSGVVNLSSLSKTQSMIRKHEKVTGEKLTAQEKISVVSQVENKSSFEVEKTLFAIFPQVSQEIRREGTTRIDENHLRLSITLTESTFKDLEEARSQLSHTLPEGTIADVIAHITKAYLKKNKPPEKSGALKKNWPMEKGAEPDENLNYLAKDEDSKDVLDRENTATTKQGVKIPKHLSVKMKRHVLDRAFRRCEYVDPISKRQCASTFRLEVDHIWPRALGGANAPENLRCLCRSHNQLMATQVLGRSMAEHWRKKL